MRAKSTQKSCLKSDATTKLMSHPHQKHTRHNVMYSACNKHVRTPHKSKNIKCTQNSVKIHKKAKNCELFTQNCFRAKTLNPKNLEPTPMS